MSRFFRFFEKLLHPYPTTEPAVPPGSLSAFLWACTQGVRGKILNQLTDGEIDKLRASAEKLKDVIRQVEI